MIIQIKHKLFFTLLLTSIVVSSGMFLFMQWSFDRGFLNYVNSQKVEGLNRLSASLIDQYSRHGEWQFLQGNERLWHQLIKATDREMEPSRPGESQPALRPPPPSRKFTPGFALFSADKKQIFAPPRGTEHLQLTPLDFQGKTIGYLALVPVKEISDAGDLLFVEQQTESFALVALAMALLSLLLAYPLTIHLLRPIKELTGGTRKLIAGRFKTRIPVMSRDELGQLSADFNSLAMTLEKNQQARQQWIADISHELRTPLSVLRGDIEALQDGIRQPSQLTFAALHGETMHLGRLVDDLYELSMSDIGALSYKKINADPVGILKETIELFEPRFGKKKLQLRSELPVDATFSLSADPDRLQQLFTNLLENSLRYTDAPGELVVRMKPGKDALFFTFEDSSPGVAEKLQPKLFERLYRIEPSRNRTSGGAGLGMAICSNIVEAHQGEIAAETSSLGGLKIIIKFPLQSLRG
ncbi:MAG: ATP-binding protein [Desulfuromusa sp.]|nr:ATP-binding protein [Desulfuromusa sp.]